MIGELLGQNEWARTVSLKFHWLPTDVAWPICITPTTDELAMQGSKFLGNSQVHFVPTVELRDNARIVKVCALNNANADVCGRFEPIPEKWDRSRWEVKP
jgi:hypothetical protein